ncbi:type I-E CRISPR-associated protein Cse1/CasA [Atlantibacter subterranea]|uniref:Type I-E CRISPR-associated protein Cse1/CasA n=1 Tax=Atlantibacter subterraneus TaxID=255519 RepID=A0ABU4E7M8_9ENTR|nr:type I-E CRISPR-associated protein Cse1/CasA [Atlantibacter subterranea]MDV7024686.1 type I-E CRISPR-associated protein Cse1/CasA [Atlantibacter subterranea]MDZ5667892.1 type I-E CRISPR-associated protein Cse1/CasA [Atlantibacter hermannii]
MEESVNRFNLIDEPWIPVADVGRVSLKRLFSDTELRALGGNAAQKIALIKLFQAICQAAATPQDDMQWQTLGPNGLCSEVLSYLERWRDRFWLYGDKPFLQMSAIARAELKSYGVVLPEVSTGNTTVLTQSQSEKMLDDGDKALLLVVQMSMALGGKKTDNSVVLTPGYRGKTNDKGKPATGKPGPALAFMGLMHSFCIGTTLAETCWLNLFTAENIAALTQYPSGLGTAPWERMPEGEDCATARELKQSLMGRLVPVSRFCLLAQNGLHYSEGISHSNYKEGLYDPSTLVNKKGKELKMQWVDPARRPWRELPALLSFINAEKQSEYECEQLHAGIVKAQLAVGEFGIWCGGLRVSSNAGEQYVSGADDAVESTFWLDSAVFSTVWFNHFNAEMEELDKLARRLYGCVSAWCREMKLEPKDIAAQATEMFWQLCEKQAQALLDGSGDPVSRAQLRKRFAGYIHQVFNHYCPRDTARQMEAWAKTRPNTADYSRTVLSEKESV